MKFRLLAGKHIGHRYQTPAEKQALEQTLKEEYVKIKGTIDQAFNAWKRQRIGQILETTYEAGDIIQSDINLVDRFRNKFERVQDDAVPMKVNAATATAVMDNDGLDDLDMKELHKIAEEEELDLRGAKTKEAIVKAIRGAR